METTNIIAIGFFTATVLLIILGVRSWWSTKPVSKAKSSPSATTTAGTSRGAATATTPATPLTPAPAPMASLKSRSWLWWIPIIALIAGLGWWGYKNIPSQTTTVSKPQPQMQRQAPLPPYYKNTPHTEQEFPVSALIEEYNAEKINDTTLRIKKGGRVRYKFCISEKKSPAEVWMLNFAMYAEKATPGGKKEVVVLQINGTSQENRLPLGWVPDPEKNARGNITIKPGATIGGCENEFSLDALTGPIIIKGPIRIIRRM